MTTIREDDLVDSIADAFQFICIYHPADYIRPLARGLRAGSVAGRR